MNRTTLLSVSTLLFTLLFTLLSGCTKAPSLQSIEGFAQGTTYHISYWHREPTDNGYIAKMVSERLASIDASMSSYRSDSTLEQFNQQQTVGPQEVGAEIVQLVRKGLRVNQASDGCYDLSIKPLFDLWGFTKDEFSVPDETAIQQSLREIGMAKVTVVDDTHLQKHTPSLQIDLSSIAQGYSVAQVAQVLEHQGIVNYLVEIGGELVVKGRKPDGKAWRVAIEKPLPDQRRIAKIITLENGDTPLAVMTSGTYRHFYDDNGTRYSHILDTRTGYPVTHQTVSVTVLYPDATLADAWSTALLCLGKDAGLEAANQQGIPALFIEQTKDGFVETSSAVLDSLSEIRIE
jgi:thiamine biosynthesis lipoprotein